MDPLIITCAPVGAEISPDQTPHLPHTPERLGDTARKIREAGASIVHVHCRNDDGSNTHDVARFREAYAAIREASDLIVQFSTGGAIGMTPDERASVLELRPEMATLTCGTVNFGDDVFENSFPIMRKIAAALKANDVRPELEIFDLGMLNFAGALQREGLLLGPLVVNLFFGNIAGMQPTLSEIGLATERIPGPPGALWSGAGLGDYQLIAQTVSLAAGGGVRVGLEDGIYLTRSRDELATNAALVEQVHGVLDLLGRQAMSPAQFRSELRGEGQA